MRLFEPITINGMRLENRIVLAPMLTRMPLGGQQEMAYFVERARGGAGLIMYHAVSIEVASQPSFVETLKPLVDALHEEGAKISCQLSVSIHRPPHRRDFFRGERVGPSAVAGRRQLTVAEIREIISMYAPSAVNVRAAGFDAVDIHGAHGLPPCIFFSPADNLRDDEYGGDVWRRMRFGLEIVESVRGEVGRAYPIIYRMAAEEERPNGITIPDAILFTRELEKATVDCLSVSIGPSARPRNFISPPGAYPLGCYVYLAAAVKPHVKVPVMGVGRINTPELAESVIAEGKADLVIMGRQLLCDPFWPVKVREGRTKDILFCSGCNHCATLYRGDVPLVCRLNKRVGHEWEMGAASR